MISRIIDDVTLFIVLDNGYKTNLSHYQELAINRWEYIIENFDSVFSGLNLNNQNLEQQYQALQKEVQVYKKRKSHANPFRDYNSFVKYKNILSTIAISDLKPLSQKEREIIKSRNLTVQALSYDDMKIYYDSINKHVRKMSKHVSDYDLNDVFTIKDKTVRSSNHGDFKELNTMLEFLDIVNDILYKLKNTSHKDTNLLQVAQGNLRDSDVVIQDIYNSGVAVPFQKSLEFMAEKYLGSSDRWLELTAVNRLSPPYVDFEGRKEKVLASGQNNKILVPNIPLNAGRKIYLGSARYQQKPFIIKSIEEHESGILLSFDKDVSHFKKGELPYVRYYKPNTMQKDSFVLIPTTDILPYNLYNYDDPNIQDLDRGLKSFGVDVKVNESDDWSFTNGNFDLSYGIESVKQTVGEVLKTVQGELHWHKNYGVPSVVGDMYYGYDQATLLAYAIQDAVIKDSRINSASIKSIINNQDSIIINLSIFINGVDKEIPLSYIG